MARRKDPLSPQTEPEAEPVNMLWYRFTKENKPALHLWEDQKPTPEQLDTYLVILHERPGKRQKRRR